MIIDEVIELNTGMFGSSEYITPEINGTLESVIISVPDGVVNVSLYLHEFMDICIMDILQLTGEQYIPIRVNTISENGEKNNFTQDKWILNNRIHCVVEGGLNINVKIILRYSKN